MCGGHRRKPPSEDNDEEEEGAATTAANAGSPQAFMLSSLKPATGKFVLGPPVDTTPPVVVFTGPADHPDPVQTARPAHHRHKKRRTMSAKAAKKAAEAKPPRAASHRKAKAKVSAAAK